MPLKLKLDDAGAAILKDGKPVYIKDDGKEIEFDADHAFNKIGQLTGEAAEFRKSNKTLTESLAKFEGFPDVETARKAIDIVSKLDQKKLIDAGEVDKVTHAAIAATETKYKPYVDRVTKLEHELFGEKIGGAFARSKTIADKFVIPADMVQAKFGSRFKVDDQSGRIVAYNDDGSKVYSNKRAGELADFEEALEIIVEGYANKNQILKGTGANGGGAGGPTQSGNGGNGGGKKIYTRQAFEKLSPAERTTAAKEVSAGKAEIRDAAPA